MPRRRTSFASTLVCGIDAGDLQAPEWRRLGATTAKLGRIDSIPANRRLQSVDCLLMDIDIDAPGRLIGKAPDLRYIGVFGTGFSNVDVEAARRRGVTVTNIPDYATNAVAEFTMAAVLGELRHLRAASSRRPPPLASLRGRELRGTSLGVVGLGRIGSKVAHLASAFGARVSYWSRTRHPSAERGGLRYLPLGRLLRQSQVISLNLALNRHTAGILGARRLTTLQPGALLLNFASAGLVDEAALLRLARSGRLHVVVDHADELRPATVRALRSLPNARIYPPIGYETEEARKARADTFVSNVERFLEGRPRNVVTAHA